MKKCMYVKCEKQTDNPKYCSLSCGAKQQSLDSPRPKKDKSRTCARAECGKTFYYGETEQRYCSRSCSATENNLRRATVKRCLFCDKDFSGVPKAQMFCSTGCRGAYKSKVKIDSWLSGEWDGSATQGLATCIKRYLIEHAGNRCASPDCAVPGGFRSINPVTNRVPLEVDHIDGDCYNNSRDNLIVLCPNCHALTPTYRALNKNSKRAYRRNSR